jgi:hypothetical protein
MPKDIPVEELRPNLLMLKVYACWHSTLQARNREQSSYLRAVFHSSLIPRLPFAMLEFLAVFL